MFKTVKLFFTIGIISLVLLGCGTNNLDSSKQTDSNTNNTVTEQEEIVVIIISKDEGDEIIAKKEIVINDGDILMDVMKDHFEIEEDGGFITSIDGIAPAEDEKKAWMYFINGDMAMVGAAEYELSAGDDITFDLQSWE